VRILFLIGWNFMREQRLVLFIFVAWIFGFGILFTLMHRPGERTDDFLMLFRQQAAYGVAYAMLTSASAIHSERKSRRILATLSKGIYRGEYLAGVLLGTVMMTGFYFGGLGLVNEWFAWHFNFHAELWPTLGALSMAALLVSSIAVCFGTFLHPAFASALTGIVVAVPYALSVAFGAKWSESIPAASVVRSLLEYQFAAGWRGGWEFLPVAIAETLFFWFIGSRIFERRDVTIAIE
jgi:hypothetical protein